MIGRINRIFGAFATSILLVTASPAIAYKENTHRDLTRYAYQNSVVAGTVLWKRLGLDLTADGKTFPGSTGIAGTAVELMEDGAEFEDGFGRPINHFFNPLTGRGLGNGVASLRPAPDWALENGGSILIQNYSYRDARASFYQALTSPLPLQRETAFGVAFETLGHLMHLIQDMAQPQHVRNDQHLDKPVPGMFNPSLFEQHAERARNNYLYRSYPSAYKDGDPQSLSAPREFWQSGANGPAGVMSGRGLAEFTNRNFVSQGTNFGGTL